MSDMKIGLTHLDGDAPAVLASSRLVHGAVLAQGCARPKFYADGAILPDFSRATTVPTNLLDVHGRYSWGADEIAVLNLDGASVQVWDEFWKNTSRMDPSQIHRHKVAERMLAETYDRIHRRLGLSSGTRRFGFTVNHPGMSTTTVDVARGELCGMHFESWESLSLPERFAARKRLSINLGPGPRWFLFVPRTLSSLTASAGAPDTDADPTRTVVNTMRTCVEEFSCVALCLQAGQAYLAPTESLMHDATSHWSTSVNFSAQFLVDRAAAAGQ